MRARLATGANARSRLRSGRTKLAAACWAICAFERQGHLVGTATGPLPEPSLGWSLSILTEPRDELAPFMPIGPEAAIRRTRFMERRGPLLRLCTRQLHHLAPFLGVVGDEFAEVGGRAGQHRAA